MSLCKKSVTCLDDGAQVPRWLLNWDGPHGLWVEGAALVRRAGSGRKDPTRPRLCNPYTVVGTEEVGASTQVMQENQSCSNNRLLFLFNLHPVVISALVITDSFAPNLDSLAVSLFFLSLTLPVPASASQSVAADRALILHRVRLGPGPQGPERNSTTLPFLAPIQPFSCTKITASMI